MRSYRPHTDSETKTVTIELGCRDTTIVHTVPSPGAQQGPDFNRLRARHMADTSRHEKKSMTLRTQIACAPGRPAAGPFAVGGGSDAERDTCGC